MLLEKKRWRQNKHEKGYIQRYKDGRKIKEGRQEGGDKAAAEDKTKYEKFGEVRGGFWSFIKRFHLRK